MKRGPHIDNIDVKKMYGQHFLRDTYYIDQMLASVSIGPESSLMEIGCGEGVLTRALLNTPAARVWVYEIDPEWASYVQKQTTDPRLTMHVGDVMRADLRCMEQHAPWILIANLPYGITFPVLHLMKQYHHYWQEGVIMIQEEVAQKIVRQGGRDYGWQSLYFQHYFELTLLDKVPPAAFYPPPRVTSRLVHWKPIHNRVEIVDEVKFWKFVRSCFSQPRRTIRNNLSQSEYAHVIAAGTQWNELRAQQMQFADFHALWAFVHNRS